MKLKYIFIAILMIIALLIIGFIIGMLNQANTIKGVYHVYQYTEGGAYFDVEMLFDKCELKINDKGEYTLEIKDKGKNETKIYKGACIELEKGKYRMDPLNVNLEVERPGYIKLIAPGHAIYGGAVYFFKRDRISI